MKTKLKQALALALLGGGSALAGVALAATTSLAVLGDAKIVSSDALEAQAEKLPHTAPNGTVTPLDLAPYCVRGYSAGVEPITLVKIDGINNATSDVVGGTPANEDFTATIGALAPGGNYPISVKGNTDGPFKDAIAVYFDWNQNNTFDAGEGYYLGSITGSTGLDGMSASSVIPVPASATLGPTRMRVTKQYTSVSAPTIADAAACGTTGFGQAEDYTVNIDPSAPVPPTLALSFAPTNAPVPASSTLTIAVGNSSVNTAVLTAAFTNTLPAGMVLATPASAATTCTGAVTAADGGSTITLANASSIPPGGCTITANVSAAVAGIYVNSIAAGALQTNQGDAGGASANFQAIAPGVPVYGVGFEAPAYTVANLNGQQGWYASVAADWKVATANPGAGSQAVRGTWTAAGSGTSFILSPNQATGTANYSIASAKLAITTANTGADWDFAPQDAAAGKVVTRVRFAKNGNIQVLAGATPAYVNTGATWTAGSYFTLKLITDRADQSYKVCRNGVVIYSSAAGAGYAPNVNNIAIIGNKGTGTQNNILDVDDVAIDYSNVGTCSGLDVFRTVTASAGVGGSIAPSGAVSVYEEDTTTFTLTPDPGAVIDNVTGTCGGTLSGNTFTTGLITSDCTVIANFVLPPPSVSKAFSPDTVEEGENSTLTITLTNPKLTSATLTAPLVDNLPAGLNATSATTNCGLVLTGGAHVNATSITLPAGVVLAAQSSCQIVATVNAATAGVYVNTIPAGALQTSAGNSADPATATLTVTGHPEIDVAPTSLSATQVTNTGTVSTLTINNLGTSDLTWTIDETNRQLNAPSALLYDNGPLVTNAGAGFGGADVSAVQTAVGNTGYGSNVSVAANMRVADDFVVPAGGWTINTITVYGYQTGSTTTSTFTAVNLRIWDGPPGQPSSNIVFGDTTTNRMASTTFSNIYRALDTDLAASNRPIMAVVATVGTTLPAGTYWVDWQLAGSLASGPWAPAVSIAGSTGKAGANALQWDATAWVALTDGGSTAAQDVPFIVDGTGSGGGGGGCTASNVSWLSVGTTSGTTPASGSTPVAVTIDSTGIGPGTYTANLCVASNDEDEPQVNVPVQLTVTPNGTTYTVTPSSNGNGTISPTAAQTVDENGSVSFTLTPDFGYAAAAAGGTCASTLSGNTLVVGPVSGNCTVEANFAPLPFPAPYCNVTFPSAVEPISRVVFTGIDNVSSTTVGGTPALEDFRAVTGGVVSLGGVYSAAVEGNTDGSYTAKVRVFVDWNRNGVFTDAGETFNLSDLVNSTGADGKQAVGEITVPAGAVLGETRMRVIKKFSTAADPCNAAGYGQAEDYTITVNNDPLPVPAIAVAPFSLSLTAMQGTSAAGTLEISNTGEAGSRLEYLIREALPDRNPWHPSAREVMQARINDVNRLRALGLNVANSQFNRNSNPSVDGVGVRGSAFVPVAASQISQMTDNSAGDEGVSCGTQGTDTADNSWWRRFYFSEHPAVGASTDVTAVTITTGSVDIAGGVASTINLYTIPHSVAADTIDTLQLTLIGTANFTATGSLATITVPVTGTVSDTAGMDLVVEWHTEGNSAGGQFFPGANATTETHPTFISSTECGIPTPVTTASINFPDFHLTMIVDVEDALPPGVGCDNPSSIPWLSANPLSGAIMQGATQNVAVTGNASGLTPGLYTAKLCIESNDPSSPRVDYDVSLDVTPLPPQIFSDGFEGDAPIGDPDVVTGTINMPIASGDTDGLTLNLATALWGTYDPGRNDNVNLYDYGDGSLAVYWYGDMFTGFNVGGVVDSGGTNFAVLASGATIGPASTISAASLKLVNWASGTDGYLGFAFVNTQTNALNYGYIRMTTTAPGGVPATVVSYGFNKAGNAITIP